MDRKPQFFTAPGGKDDDPRQIVWVCVDDVVIDQNVQRPVRPERLRAMGEWTWDAAETPTVSVRDSGIIVGVEGQHRITKLQKERPGSWTWCIVATDNTLTAEALGALKIAASRQPHSPLAKYRLRLSAGEPYARAIQQVLDERGLSVTEHSNRSKSDGQNITAVAALEWVAAMGETPGEAMVFLGDTLAIIEMGAVVLSDHPQSEKWDPAFIRATGRIVARNQGTLRQARMVKVLQGATTDAWLRLTETRRRNQTRHYAVGQQLITDYNKQLAGNNHISW